MAATTDIPFHKLEEQLTCQSCHRLYNNPKILPCHHSFCQKCLEGLPQEMTKARFISCPTCTKKTELPEPSGIDGFPTSTSLNSFKQIYKQLKNNLRQVTCDNCNADHGTGGYCVECRKFLCQVCINMHKKWTSFNNHHITDLDSIVPTSSSSQPAVELPKATPEESKRVYETLSEREKEIRQQGEEVKKEINQIAKQLMETLETQLTKEVDVIVEKKLQVLAKQKEMFERNLQQSIDIQQSLMMTTTDELSLQINLDEFIPLEKADIHLIKSNEIDDIRIFHDICQVVSSIDVQECKLKEIANVKCLPNSDNASFELTLEYPDSSPLTVPVSSINCSLVPVGKEESIKATVTSTTNPGVYNIEFKLIASGSHQVNVQVYDVQLESTSSLMIPFDFYLDTITPVYHQLGSPLGVGVSNDGCIIVTQPNNAKLLLNVETELKVITANTCKSWYCNAMVAVVDSNNVYIIENQTLLKHMKFTSSWDNEELIASVGTEGSGPLKFKTLGSIAVSPVNDQIFVSDHKNCYIQVLTSNFTFCRLFGSEGTEEGQFNTPYDIAIDNQGLVYVTDHGNHRIQKFTSKGQFIAQFGTKGNGPGQLLCPQGITIDRSTGLLYITEGGNHRISVFTCEGQFAYTMGQYGVNEDQFNNPRGIDIDKRGVLYVCDCGNNRLVIYRPKNTKPFDKIFVLKLSF